ncbi:LysM peptidoglycan-binding domain-containing protein [Methylotenera versatilis]|uniref:Peptidoglycan-binding lysin domain protein n=1 Tax=Methylotenera versatilis (strain 301) TaxID=666681 RepID=D7DKY5_METV0|nr:LysM peptidoglycan-binding domain-containing protein [Methylotenera versatilis]ADI28596.1 Peptidoglycan-binding lysin domain protein [Methylotenera versatilis 301]
MFRYIITLLMFCCISFNVNAQVVALKSDHPDRHVVVKGDTLWGISAKFLKDPWQWPSIWKLNRAQIKNPHWIYPGDVIVLDMSSGTPQLRLLRETVTLQPGAVEEPLDKTAISTIQLSVIGPFLSQPLVIEKDQLAKSPRIIANQDNRVVLSPGTRVYINKIAEGGNLNWYVYRPGDNLVDPDTKKVLGVEATYLGDAKITKYGEPASADITKAKEEIFTKDRLVATGDDVITNFVPHAPDSAISGRIIKIYGGVAEAGPQSIVSISRGTKDGIEVGHVLAVNRYGAIIKDPEYVKEKDAKDSKSASGLEPGMVKLPDERVGLLMVFRVFENVSYALVMQASQPINTLDSVTTP